MPTKKFAISIPEAVMAGVDRAARLRGVTRSRFIAQVLQRASSAQSDAELREAIDSLFNDPDVVQEQSKTSEAFADLVAPEGTEW